jgi:hypothetical protein
MFKWNFILEGHCRPAVPLSQQASTAHPDCRKSIFAAEQHISQIDNNYDIYHNYLYIALLEYRLKVCAAVRNGVR